MMMIGIIIIIIILIIILIIIIIIIIIIKNLKEKTCLIIDVAMPADRNVIMKETNNLNIMIWASKFKECGDEGHSNPCDN